MAGRPAPATQASLERAIRAAKATGLTVFGIVAESDRYIIETNGSPITVKEQPDAPALDKWLNSNARQS